MRAMNIFTEDQFRKDVQALVASPGMSIHALSKVAGVDGKSLNRLLQGAGVNSATIEKLWPFLYGDKCSELGKKRIPAARV